MLEIAPRALFRRKIRSGRMIVRVRLGSSLARFAPAGGHLIKLELPAGATIEDLYAGLASSTPELGPALASALPVVGGAHVERSRTLSPGEEIALLTPVAGG
jgi:molybdopterin converting factor small subunit